jgi:nucleotide-binding universal stress UspA family protein
MQAVGLACEIAKKNKGRVYAVHVIEVKRTLPLDAPMQGEEDTGEVLLERAEGVAKKQGYKIESEILHAREAGPALVDEAIARRADLIILGIPYSRPFGQYEVGRVAEYVLRSAPCEVWLCRHRVGE